MADRIFTGGNHIGIVTADMDRAVRLWADRYGVGPWSVYRYDSSNMTAAIGGEPVDFAMLAGLCNLGPGFRMEIIQPLDDRSHYAESLAAHGGADHVHHVRLDIADFNSAARHLDGLGLATLFEGSFKGAVDDGTVVRARYFATADDLGFTVEVAEAPADFVRPEPEYVYPASSATSSEKTPT